MNALPEMPMNSAIYTGTIRHRRFEPVGHEFTYRMFMLYLDLDELDSVFENSRLFSTSGRAAAEFRRTDHFGDPDQPLDIDVRELVRAKTGHYPRGPVRLLTHLRYFGYIFNPVSFYYCFDPGDHYLEAIVAEVNNTPWGERHCYVLPISTMSGNDRVHTFSPEKVMHVSPFMPMDVDYNWRLGKPGDNLNVHMANLEQGRKMFDATLRLERRAISPAALARSLAAYPLMTLRVIFAIHWQALRLWMKGCTVYDHPDKRRAAGATGKIGR